MNFKESSGRIYLWDCLSPTLSRVRFKIWFGIKYVVPEYFWFKRFEQSGGTQRLLVSLWEVEDKAMSELMARFYRKLFKGKMTAAAALCSTQLEMMRDKRQWLPFYWSPFILQGDWK